MKSRDWLKIFLLLSLLLEIAVLGGVSASKRFPGKFDASSRGPRALSPDTKKLLSTLDDRIFFTFVVSDRNEMPTGMKRVEQETTEALERIRSAAPDIADYEILDPSKSEDIATLAAMKKVARWHAPDIRGDRKSEKTIWSSLVISMKDRRDVVVDEIGPEKASLIEKIIVEHLKNMADPIEPTIGIAAPTGYSLLSKHLAAQGRTQYVVLSAGIPDGLDMLYIMEPPMSLTRNRILEVRRFVESGRTVVLADTLYRAVPFGDGSGDVWFNYERKYSGAQALLAEFGLSLKEAMLLDERCESYMRGASETVFVPLAVKAGQTAFNFKNFAGELSGNLSFMESVVVGADTKKIESLGYDMQTVVSSSDRVWTNGLPETARQLSLSDLSPAIYLPKQPLAAMLIPRNSFGGNLLVFSSTAMFKDNGIEREGFSHRPLVKLLGRTFLSPDRLVNMRMDRGLPPPIKAPNPDGAVKWRIVTVLLAPLAALLALALRRRKDARPASLAGARRYAVAAVAALAAIIALAAVSGLLSSFGADLSEGRINSLSPALKKTVAKSSGKIKITFYMSPDSDLSPEIRRARKEVLRIAGRLAAAERGKVSFKKIRVANLSEIERAQLVASGVAPVEIERNQYDAQIKKTVWNNLSVDVGERKGASYFIDGENIDDAEFLIMSAIETALRGRPLNIAIASDMPRLSPAEAFEDYFRKQLAAPVGSDVYSDAKQALESRGFKVSHIDPKAPEIPLRTDLLIWLQPRRPVDGMAMALAGHLAGGGSAIVAMQHYNIQQRQYMGRAFVTVYWPQPQYMDLNSYLETLGVRLEKEVLMDETRTAAELETQINRSATREYDSQAVAKPFLIRTVASSYKKGFPATDRLGDLLFAWGNRFSLDASRLDMLGLSATPFVSASPHSWRYVWNGGFIGEDVFRKKSYLGAPQPLAVMVSGKFPTASVKPGMSENDPSIYSLNEQAKSPTESSLALIGCSEMFKNQNFARQGFQHDRFLINLVAGMTLGPEAPTALNKKDSPRGFAQPGRGTILKYRAFAMFAAALAALIFGLLWKMARDGRRSV